MVKTLVCFVGGVAALSACSAPAPTPTLTELATGAPTSPYGPYGAAVYITDEGRIVGSYGRTVGPGSRPEQAAEFLDDGNVVLLPIPTGYLSCGAMGILDDGTVVGNCTTTSSRKRIVTWDSSRISRELFPPDINSEALDLNRHDVLLEQVFVEENGSVISSFWLHDLHTEKRTRIPGNAYGINDVGDIVGTVVGSASPVRTPVKWSGDPLVATTLPGCVGVPNDINNHGVIVGACSLIGVPPLFETGVIWASATAVPQTLPSPPAPTGRIIGHTRATDISDSGIAIGNATQLADDTSRVGGAAWTADRRVVDLGSLIPEGINAAGVIVGTRDGGSPYKVELGEASSVTTGAQLGSLSDRR